MSCIVRDCKGRRCVTWHILGLPFTIWKTLFAYFWPAVESVSICFVWNKYCMSHKIYVPSLSCRYKGTWNILGYFYCRWENSLKFLQKNPSLPEIKVDYLLSSQFRKDGSRKTENSALEHMCKNSILGFQQYSHGEGCLAAYLSSLANKAISACRSLRTGKRFTTTVFPLNFAL